MEQGSHEAFSHVCFGFRKGFFGASLRTVGCLGPGKVPELVDGCEGAGSVPDGRPVQLIPACFGALDTEIIEMF